LGKKKEVEQPVSNTLKNVQCKLEFNSKRTCSGIVKAVSIFTVLLMVVVSVFSGNIFVSSTINFVYAYDPNNPDEVYEAMSQNSKARKQTQEAQEGVQQVLQQTEADIVNTEEVLIPAANEAARVADANYQVAQEKAQKLQRRLEAAQADKDRIEKELDVATTQYDSSRTAIASLAREEMRGDNQYQSLQLMTNANNSEAFVDSLETTSAAARTQARILNNAALVKAGAANKDARLKIVNSLIEQLKRDADENERLCQSSKEQADNWRAQLQTLEAELVQKKAALEEQKRNLATLLAQQEAAQRQYEADMRALAEKEFNFDGSGGQFGWPVSSHCITGRFGVMWLNGIPHRGIDFGCGGNTQGTPIYAAADGEVEIAIADERPGGYFLGANAIVINHGKSDGVAWATAYLHMMPGGVYVSEGEWVMRGQKIGAEGRTGFVTGPHLHFEIWRNGVPINPCSMLGC
jgi:murein DD-endopeptidase MepM/ murein hydrolase activator NlpD